jgi:hypothetical protein
MEVDYYKGRRITRDERLKLQADKATFDKKHHKNVDVETGTERWEMKRVNPPVTDRRQFLYQIKEGVQKFTSIGIPSAAHGGAKTNLVDVDFGNRLQIAGDTDATMRATLEEYITHNAGARQCVDAIIIHADLPTGHVDLRVDVK